MGNIIDRDSDNAPPLYLYRLIPDYHQKLIDSGLFLKTNVPDVYASTMELPKPLTIKQAVWKGVSSWWASKVFPEYQRACADRHAKRAKRITLEGGAK